MTLHTEPSCWLLLPNFYIQCGINSGLGGVEPFSRAPSSGMAEPFRLLALLPQALAATALLLESVALTVLILHR